MTRHLLLLRGVNVGRANRIRTDALVALLEGLGCSDVRTYLQSGNAVVSSDSVAGELEAAAEQALAAAGVPVRVLSRSAQEVEAVVSSNPFAGRDLDPKLLHVGFLDAVPDPVRAAALESAELLPERAVVRGREAYLWYAQGVLETRMDTLVKRLGVVVTARNWRTVLALRDLVARPG